MSEYPRFKYHPTKEPFICPSEAFLESLKDKDEYEDEPFTGPRAVKPPVKQKEQCKDCLVAEFKITDLKLEVERLRIALKMAEAKANTKPVPAPVKKAGRPKKV